MKMKKKKKKNIDECKENLVKDKVNHEGNKKVHEEDEDV